MEIIPHLAGINATMNALSATFLLSAFVAIKMKRRDLHRNLIYAALTASALFLAGYITRALNHGTKAFPGTGWAKTLYFWILIPHMILAVAVLPMIARSLMHALKGDFASHRGAVKFAWPIWMYVSLTGVVVYLMLYEWPRV